ncbi:helix-turn-helix transcriptional regulator [Leucobacter sp. cx-42]|uniref:helix-turn-helix domain-containing protein n=1 Tax=unclassified Leucobacter TaxID=2621730 RepID=UPI00165E426B|nr:MULTISPECIES: helix-turn-helix transcriptional regulator [unclassified Leucobacter]MBC9954681.1 helix-turn-helix transcriptional regulator [Leucobacter sp. cx-42]
MHSTKQDFGRFVSEHRKSQGLTQRELATALHVTESAISKWERGLSYPDITVIPSLSRALGVSADELMNASEDQDAREEKREARSYRKWRTAILWSTSLAYAAALITCFIVNISVSHRLDWFWIVLAAVALAASLTTLPLFNLPAKGWLVLGSATVSLLALLGITALVVGSGAGTWLPITLTAILLGLVICFGPIWLSSAAPPQPAASHKMVISLALDTVALLLFITVTMLVLDRGDALVMPTLALVAIGLIPFWICALVIRYVPLHGLTRAGIVLGILGALSFSMNDWISAVLDSPITERRFDLARWDGAYLDGNIAVLVSAGLIALAVIFILVGIVRGAQRRRQRR